MKKIFKTIGSIVGFAIAIFFIFSLIYDLIFNTIDTLIRIGELVAFGIVVLGIIWLHLTLEEKNHIDWDNYPELRTICRWICFSSWLFFGFAILYGYSISIIVTMLMLAAFSFWTYFSLILAKKNALFLLRSFLLIISIFLLWGTGNICRKSIEINFCSPFDWNIFFDFVGIVFLGLIIALCIKGLILTFKSNINDLFKDYRISFVQIAIVTVILIGMIRMRNTTITFNHIDYPTSKETLSTK